MSQCAVFFGLNLGILLLPEAALVEALVNDLDQGHLVSCGRSDGLRQTRIVGGVPARAGQVPWQLALRRNGVQVCGAAILTSGFAVTAAHCIKPNQRIQLQAGTLFLNATGANVQARDVDQVLVHPLWRKGSWSNDLALLKVSEPFDLVEGLTTPICLKPLLLTSRNPIIVSGWGRTNEANPRQPQQLQLTWLQPVSNNRCKKRFPYAFSAPEMFCAYGPGGKDTCKGDSGGAAAELLDGVFYLRGLVSWGSGCARPHTPGVYTKITPQYIDWIRQTVAANGREEDVAQLKRTSSVDSVSPERSTAEPSSPTSTEDNSIDID